MLSVFVVPEITPSSSLEVEGDEAHHAIKVMRLGVGEEIVLTDGTGSWAQGRVEEIHKKSFSVAVTKRGFQEERIPELIVIQALTKSDRMRETIEMLTVAGVHRIIPWSSERSIAQAKDDSVEKWNLVAIAASKQSRRVRFPIIEQPMTTNQIRERFGDSLLVLHESASHQLRDVKFLENEPIVLLVGPEGGISESEMAKLGGISIRLGEEVLRSAHAGFAALAAIQTLIHRW